MLKSLTGKGVREREREKFMDVVIRATNSNK